LNRAVQARAADPQAARAVAAGRETLRRMGRELGLWQRPPEVFFKTLSGGDRAAESRLADIEALVEGRNEARRAKNWAEADRLRDELLARGVVLEDRPGGTVWKFGH
jgi:cysteinyl-tRNA synthetase